MLNEIIFYRPVFLSLVGIQKKYLLIRNHTNQGCLHFRHLHVFVDLQSFFIIIYFRLFPALFPNILELIKKVIFRAVVPQAATFLRRNKSV